MKFNFKEFENLPERIDCNELRKYFISFIDLIKSDHEYSPLELIEMLVELSDKQWHTYEKFDSTFKEPLENWLIEMIDINDSDLIDNVIFIIAHLGLQKAYDFLRKVDKRGVCQEILNTLSSAFDELGSDIEDPYKI